MDFKTPIRVLRAAGRAEGRQQYRRALRNSVWKWLGRLPWEVNVDARLNDGAVLRLSSRDQVISRSLFVAGEWEPDEAEFIRQSMRPGMIAIDVGANIGVHTLAMAQCAGENGVVHAFEPTQVFDRLRENVRRNRLTSRIRLNRCAVGDREGTARFLVTTPGNELFTSQATPLVPEVATGEFDEYLMTTLDAYAEKTGLQRIDFLKVDVEGGEGGVLRGARDLLRRRAIALMMMELNDPCLRNNGSSALGLLHQAEESGYAATLLGSSEGPADWKENLDGCLLNVILKPF